MSAGRFAAISVFFLLSGLGSLVLEIAWTRQLRLVFGSTTLAASTILVSYRQGDWQRTRELLQQGLAEDPAYEPVQADLERVRVAERERR